MANEIKTPDTTELEAKIGTHVAEAEQAVINTIEDYNLYKAKQIEITRLEKEGLEIFDHKDPDPTKQGICASTYASWKSACALRDKVVTERLTKAKKIYSLKLGTWWDNDQKRIAEENKKREEEARSAEAKRLKDEGATKTEVKNVLNGKTNVVLPPPIQQEATVGRRPRVYFYADIFDLSLFIKTVASAKIPLRAVIGIKFVNEAEKIFECPYMNTQAEALKDEFSYPGVRLRKETRA